MRAGVSSTSLVIRNRLSELLRLSAWVQAWAQKNAVPEVMAQYVDLCATELVTNVVNYAYADDGEHLIEMCLCRFDDRTTLEIADDGKPFDPLETPERPRTTDLDTGRVGGWGIGIVRHFADDMRYSRAGKRNCLTVVFRHEQGAPR